MSSDLGLLPPRNAAGEQRCLISPKISIRFKGISGGHALNPLERLHEFRLVIFAYK